MQKSRSFKKLFITMSIFVVSIFNSLPAQAFSNFYSDSDIQYYNKNACDPNGENGSSDNLDQKAQTYTGPAKEGVTFTSEMNVNTDGSGQSHGNTYHQAQTSFTNGGKPLNADELNFIALSPPWAEQKGLKLGDLVLVEYKNKKIFAIYGDNWNNSGQVHGEGSYRMIQILSGKKDPNINVAIPPPVKYTVYPESHKKLPSSFDQKKVDEIGSQISGLSPSTNISSNDSAGGACCESQGGSGTQLSGGDNAEKVWNFLISKGLSNAQAAGIMGNLQQESGFDPTIVNPSSGAYGLAQWYAGRKTALEKYASSVGKQKSDLGVQLDYLWKELNGSYKSSVLDPIKATNSMQEVLKIWLERFEVPCLPGACGSEIAKRTPFAQKWLNKAGGGAGSTAPADSANTDPGGDCGSSGGSESSIVNPDGYALPVDREVVAGQLPCKQKTCHHDGTPAADLGIAEKWKGKPVYAITDGKISNLHYRRGLVGPPAPPECKSFQLVGKDGYQYWYGHIKGVTVKQGDTVKAGQKVAIIGQSACADTTPPHLHIDRGFPKGTMGGMMNSRDWAFIPLLNKIYESTGG